VTCSIFLQIGFLTAIDLDLKLRLAVEGGGCSGLQFVQCARSFASVCLTQTIRYKFSLDPNPAAADDAIFSFYGMENSKVIIDNVSLGLINGSTIDYVEEMMSSSFRVKDNPNSKQSCGCGSSFEPKKV